VCVCVWAGGRGNGGGGSGGAPPQRWLRGQQAQSELGAAHSCMVATALQRNLWLVQHGTPSLHLQHRRPCHVAARGALRTKAGWWMALPIVVAAPPACRDHCWAVSRRRAPSIRPWCSASNREDGLLCNCIVTVSSHRATRCHRARGELVHHSTQPATVAESRLAPQEWPHTPNRICAICGM
jgi:hypothetical protein